MKYRTTSYASGTFDTYWYERNLQGDIVAIYGDNGKKYVSYYYDAWGNHTENYFNSGATVTAVKNNPLRYRGYYYDIDLQLYYLQSRYYDSSTGRFINADGYISTGTGILGYNMYSYCNNNPVMYTDSEGNSPGLILGLVVLGAVLIVALTSCSPQQPTEEQIQQAIDAADRAYYHEAETEKGYSTFDIDIEIEDAIKSVDHVAYDYYYQALYEESIEFANSNNIPTDHLMTLEHIQWEYDLHRLGKALGSSNANTTELNYDETPLKMFLRWVGVK